MNFITEAIASAGDWRHGGTLLIVAVAVLAGFLTGRCVWRADRRRLLDEEKVNADMRAQAAESD